MSHGRAIASLLLLAAVWPGAQAGEEPIFPSRGDRPASYAEPAAQTDFTRSDVSIRMRDGVALHTVILIPKGASSEPIVLVRTPYGVDKSVATSTADTLEAAVPQNVDAFARAGYILVYQDIRGQHESEGEYVLTRPPRGPLNPTNVDEVTDAWDSIDWLIKHVPQSNRRVGMIGSSYAGHTVAMALLDPHPALKVAAPESPMIDDWIGDDWFHYGAFRQYVFDYLIEQESPKGSNVQLIRHDADDYTMFLEAGSAGDFAKAHGFDSFGAWRRMAEHPSYDFFWQGQALHELLAKHPSNVPTVWLQGLWDQEDIWGAVHAWERLKAAGAAERNYLVVGPWNHSQINHSGYNIGPFRWRGNTTAIFRQEVLLPFFNQYLRANATPFRMPRVQIYNSGENRWDHFSDWPLACERGCPNPMTPLYLAAGSRLSFSVPREKGSDSYISDPAHPVPFMPRPVHMANAEEWGKWLVSDQRNMSARPDVLSYTTPVLTHPVTISGSPVARLYARTSGSDGDFVVKLIDVHPPQVPEQPELGGYQQPIAMEIFRGRYRKSFEHPEPVVVGRVLSYHFALPATNHVFQPGHRIMVQVQSTWFPLYDRNPQTYVANIFFAAPSDYQAAKITVERSPEAASAVLLPLVGTKPTF